MRVSCIENDLNAFKGDSARYEFLTSVIHLRDGILPLTVGNEYQVFAVAVLAGQTSFYISNDHELSYPAPYSACFFALVDGAVPAGWALSPHGLADGALLLTFAAWAADPTFYERLVDGDADAQRIFDEQRASRGVRDGRRR